MMPPPLHVCNGLASPADAACCIYYQICEVVRYVAAPVCRRFKFSVVSCSLVSLVLFHPKCVGLSVGGSDHFPGILSKPVQYSREGSGT